jgi:hypothetical protein
MVPSHLENTTSQVVYQWVNSLFSGEAEYGGRDTGEVPGLTLISYSIPSYLPTFPSQEKVL